MVNGCVRMRELTVDKKKSNFCELWHGKLHVWNKSIIKTLVTFLVTNYFFSG